MNYIQLFVQSIISPRFYGVDRQQHLVSLCLWFPCWHNQSGISWRWTQMLLLLEFRILDAIVVLYIWFIDRCAIVFAVVWIFQVASPVKLIFCFRNSFRRATIAVFDSMTMDSPDLAEIYDLSSYTWQVLCSQSWWQRWSFWQCKCSRTIRLKQWPGCYDDLFHAPNVSKSFHLLILSARFLLCSM